MSTAEALIQRQAARQRGASMISLGGEAPAPYSLVRAVFSENAGGFEAEVSSELERALNGVPGFQNHGGVFVPPQLFAALQTGTPTAGQELVFTVPGPFGRALRPHPVAARLGARIVPGPYNIRLVRVAAGHQVTWLSTEVLEEDLAQQQAAFASEAPQPALGMVSTSWSRRLDAVANPAVGEIVEDDIRAAVAAAIDAGLIAGTGEDGEPLGLAARALPSIDLQGAAIEWDDLLEAEATIADANADEGLAWLASGRGRQALRSVAVLGNAAAGPAWRGNAVLDWPAFVSNHAGGSVILGAWRNAVIALHAVEILRDPYTGVGQGLIKAVAFVLVSVGVVHSTAFLMLRNPLLLQPAS